jgi:hypothetical protein
MPILSFKKNKIEMSLTYNMYVIRRGIGVRRVEKEENKIRIENNNNDKPSTKTATEQE